MTQDALVTRIINTDMAEVVDRKSLEMRRRVLLDNSIHVSPLSVT